MELFGAYLLRGLLADLRAMSVDVLSWPSACERAASIVRSIRFAELKLVRCPSQAPVPRVALVGQGYAWEK
ncbi:protein of unknown function [Candidatus Hydrogenisulfobacillus filiaventi]|uniref:Uncharacterized protein n=1 Tax=Candidatus Hydrogenisulfobacillus filiaventi TaxID=2707344 RepID=A0A6F8ZJM1_9FIRM|nr:protein of unknown function [Candidatus Hydrogenisulfobacillus filiaventi]